ncbi:MAG: hypothetical protein AAF705_22490 [Bacteroidota bacterium]
MLPSTKIFSLLFARLLMPIALLSLLQTCGEEETIVVDIDYGYRYYPTIQGQEKIFEVDSIIYGREGTVIDSTSGFVREIISAVQENQDGSIMARIERYYRRNAVDAWVLQSFNTLERNDNQAILQEGNQSILKMIFPATLGTTWDPTSFITANQNVVIAGDPIDFYKNWEGSIFANDLTYIGATNGEISNILGVQLADSENLIERRKVEEWYAPNLGLVYREIEILDTQCQKCCNGDTGSCLDIPWPEKAEQGLHIVERLLEY